MIRFAPQPRICRSCGKTYPSIRALAKAHGRNYVTVAQRLNRGQSIAEALRPPMPLSERGRMAKATAFRRVY